MNAKTKKRIMALDLGDARVGIALSDPLGLTAQPFATLEVKGLKNLFEKLGTIIIKEDVGTVVIGLPKSLTGEISEQGHKVEKFFARFKSFLAKELSKNNIETVLWDERLTTMQAERIIVGSGLRNKERSSALDKISAAIILESFMNRVEPKKLIDRIDYDK